MLLWITGVQTQDGKYNNQEIRQAQTFFGVVALFFIGHTLRIFLNFYEVGFMEDILPLMKEVQNMGCVSYRPFWIHVSYPIILKYAKTT